MTDNQPDSLTGYNGELLDPTAIDSAWPLLDALPFPVMQIDTDYRVIATNRAAAQQYTSVHGCCYQVSHGYDSPCNENGETCPKLSAQNSRSASAVLHIHQMKSGVEKLKVQAIPIEGGGILELHIPLNDVTTIDILTGLTNRAEGEQQVRRYAALMKRTQARYALVMLDLDRFKSVNDTYGHLAGDLVLASFTEVLRNTVRESDIAIRYGGEEFLVMLLNADQTAAEQFAQRVLEATRELEIVYEEHTLRITVSAGIRCLEAEELQSVAIDLAVSQADAAMYRAKQAGRDRFEVYAG